MRLHTKASPAKSTPSSTGRRVPSLFRLACLVLLSVVASLSMTSAAHAVEVNRRPVLFSFDGSDTTYGKLNEARGIAVDQVNGLVYVRAYNAGPLPGATVSTGNVVSKFDLDGKAQPFSGLLGQSSFIPKVKVDGFLGGIAVDSYGANPGRIYLLEENGPIEAFNPAGESLWTMSGLSEPCGLTTDIEGNPWVGDYAIGSREYATSGSPPAQSGVLATPEVCRLAVDASGNVYANRWNGAVEKYEEGGAKVSTISPGVNSGVVVDQTSPTGHVFVLHSTPAGAGQGFSEYDSSGNKLGTYGSGGKDIAYVPSLDRVYLLQGIAVDVYGPAEIGDAPAVTLESITDVGLRKATLHGKVDPDALPETSYRFEWKVSSESEWSSSPVQELPSSDGEILTSFPVKGLRSNSKYEARLVGVNDETGFTLASDVVTFETLMPPPPTVTINEPTHSAFAAKVTATIDPMGDVTRWQVEKSTDPACAVGFTSEGERLIDTEEAGPVEVERDLTGILPATHYCVRIRASNGHKTEIEPGQHETTIVTSDMKEFTTESIPPFASTAFAAPRTDTTARINGRYNPNGLDVTYRFEWSDDGGETWTAFPDREDTSKSHDPVTVSEELTGLSPSSAYSYRFIAENAIGAAVPQGVEKTFTTRSTAEMSAPARGIELVSNPNKGNQHVLVAPISDEEGGRSESALSEDGEHAAWQVRGGAPGGTVGAGDPFIATRDATGWLSAPLLPPVEEQFGGGDKKFELVRVSPDFNRSIMVGGEGVYGSSELGVVRNDGQGGQETLLVIPSGGVSGMAQSLDTTTDLAHALLVHPETGLLADYGTGAAEVVGLLDDDEPPACGITGFYGFEQPHWIATTDASRVYFRSQGDNCKAPVGLYVRNRDAGTTTQLAADGQFLRTSPDGRSALFVTPEALAGNDGNDGRDVYRRAEGEQSECLTCIVPNASVDAVRASRDLSRVYFTSGNQLVAGEGKPGATNLYVVRSDGSLDFVAVVSSKILFDFEKSRLTRDGEVLLFSAHSRPTTDEVVEICNPVGNESIACPQLYRYHDGDGSIECISCKVGEVSTKGVVYAGSGLALSSDGDTAAFVTPEALVPEDVNNAKDVYEWRDGVQRLVTDGETKFPPNHNAAGRPWVRGIDADGQGILFSVAGVSITGFEQDGLSNLYVARLGGGFAPPSPQIHCDGDSCQGSLQAAPVASAGASSTYRGRGNLKPQVRKRKPCVRKRGKAKRSCMKRQRARAKAKAGRGK